MQNIRPPLVTQVVRGTNIESYHEASAVVITDNGKSEMAFGDCTKKIYPRSSIKPIQALNLILSGAVDKFHITDEELALACASHSGEKIHVQLVSNWLTRLGLTASDLECGAHAPSNQNAALELFKSGNDISALHNNCSGKHTGMLASCLSLGYELKGYVKTNHPIQVLIKDIIEDFCSEKINDSDIAIDGCSIPTYFISMNSLGLGMARFGSANSPHEKYKEATTRLFNAIVNNPSLIAGSDRYCTRMTEALNKTGFVKTGAEGVMFACIPEHKLGIVVKAHDGTTRAAEVTMSWILKELGLLNKDSWEKFSQIPIKNWNLIQTGYISIK